MKGVSKELESQEIESRIRMVQWWKRPFDIVCSGIGLVLASPLLLLSALTLIIVMGRPVFFSQERPGLRGEPFTLYKFRTMTDARNQDGILLPDRERLTRVGRLLRSASVDELPQLLNVLKGEMSLVGPRPLLPEYLPHYSPRESMRHLVRPGITGLAQVSGRNALGWEQRLELDAEYVERISVWLDLRILAATVVKAVTRAGVADDSREAEGNLADLRTRRQEAKGVQDLHVDDEEARTNGRGGSE